jgi:monoamine oxidase
MPNPVKETRLEFIHKVQRPLQNLFVVGEMVSLNQGWVEGALQSVQEVIGELS